MDSIKFNLTLDGSTRFSNFALVSAIIEVLISFQGNNIWMIKWEKFPMWMTIYAHYFGACGIRI